MTKDDNRPNKISFWILVLVSSYGGAGVQVLKAGLRIGSESLKTRLRQFRGIEDPARSNLQQICKKLSQIMFNEFQGHPGGAK